MNPTPELIDDIYIERVLRARQTPLAEKILAGPRLFEFGCEAMRAGILALNPEATEAEVKVEMERRFAIGRFLEGKSRE